MHTICGQRFQHVHTSILLYAEKYFWVLGWGWSLLVTVIFFN